jgi:hypothetical protein
MKTKQLICYEPKCSLVKKGELVSLFQIDLPDCYCGCIIDNETKGHLPRYRIIKVRKEELDESKVKGKTLEHDNYILTVAEDTRFLGFGKKSKTTIIPYSPKIFELLREQGRSVTQKLSSRIR